MAPKLTFNQPGAIVRLRLRNFMTYNDVSLQPGPNLNMIIGPNGTGKSAIVCSIIVGLAGDVSLTGRASNITNLVQKGCEWASTEIELFNDKGRNHVIERKISIISREEGKVEHKSEWKLNGNKVPMRTITKLIEELNIKVDNLCQFLPQDSVASFVKMNPSELLNNTLKAVGDFQLVEDLSKLVELTDDINAITTELTKLEEESKINEVNAKRLEGQVQELRAKKQLVEKRKLCSLKLHYVKYLEALDNCDRANDILRDKMENLRQQKSYGAPVQEKINFYKREEEKYRELTRTKIEESKEAVRLVKRSWEVLENRKMKCQEEFAKFRTIKEREEQREQQISLKQQELDSYKGRLEEIRDVDYTSDIANLKEQAKEVQTAVINKNEEKNAIRQNIRTLQIEMEVAKAKKNELLSIRDKRLSFVLNKRQDYRRVCDWLSMNNDSFQKEILLPMYCDLNIKNPAFADIIEFVLQEQDLYAFICQTDDDLKRFTQYAHDNLKARIGVILQPDKSVEEFENELPNRSPFRNFKFAGFLKDMIDAPEPIMRYLYGQYNFHKVPVFDDLNEQELKNMMDTCPKFFLRKVFYNVQKSRYDAERTVYNEKVQEAKLLKHSSFNKKQLEELVKTIANLDKKKADLDDRINGIDKEVQECQQKFAELNRKCSELLSKQSERDRVERHIKICSERLEELRSEKVDIATEQVKLQKSIEKIDHQCIEDLDKLDKILNTYTIVRQNHMLNAMLAALARKNYRLAEISYADSMKKAKELELQIEEEKKKIDALKTRVNLMKEQANDAIKGFKNGRLDNETKRKFDGIVQDTVDSLERYEEELNARIQGMHSCVGDRLLDEFNSETRKLNERRHRIEELRSSTNSKKSEQAAIKDRFSSKINDVIGVIDEHYKVFMQRLNYGGKVELAFDPSNPDDFTKYGINIMVKYRDNEQLIPLSSTRQSGGERSVATMIYMLALQTKTSVPFRVVDEINQGMDKDNERKVFELLVRTADESSSQYFLVSPKLLNGLNYGDQMQIHIVYNGPHLDFSFNDLK